MRRECTHICIKAFKSRKTKARMDAPIETDDQRRNSNFHFKHFYIKAKVRAAALLTRFDDNDTSLVGKRKSITISCACRPINASFLKKSVLYVYYLVLYTNIFTEEHKNIYCMFTNIYTSKYACIFSYIYIYTPAPTYIYVCMYVCMYRP